MYRMNFWLGVVLITALTGCDTANSVLFVPRVIGFGMVRGLTGMPWSTVREYEAHEPVEIAKTRSYAIIGFRSEASVSHPAHLSFSAFEGDSNRAAMNICGVWYEKFSMEIEKPSDQISYVFVEFKPGLYSLTNLNSNEEQSKGTPYFKAVPGKIYYLGDYIFISYDAQKNQFYGRVEHNQSAVEQILADHAIASSDFVNPESLFIEQLSTTMCTP